jgi:hypothetical protein
MERPELDVADAATDRDDRRQPFLRKGLRHERRFGWASMLSA